MENKDPSVIGKRVKSARMLAGLSRKSLSESSSISAATLRSWEDPKGSRKGLTEKGALRLIKALNSAGVKCSISWLMYGSGSGSGSGPSLIESKFHTSEPKDISWNDEESIFREVEFFKQVNHSSIVRLIKDRGMEPFFEQNSYVGGHRVGKNNISSLVGLNCIIEAEDGRTFVRRLQAGNNNDKYTLQCINPAKEIDNILITDIALSDAAEIVWYRKRCSYDFTE